MLRFELADESEEVFDLCPHGRHQCLIHQTVANSVDEVDNIGVIGTQSSDSNGQCVEQFVTAFIDNDVVFARFVFQWLQTNIFAFDSLILLNQSVIGLQSIGTYDQNKEQVVD